MNGAACTIPNHAIRGYLQKNCASIDKQDAIACGCSNRSAFEENFSLKTKNYNAQGFLLRQCTDERNKLEVLTLNLT